ncbi:MAG: FAD-dependent monooxygenase [Anderseniella sp.]|jgi:2-octaprenyl-6-methoxyphenol hydroxylase|nr:FAD-dependent monooxygenase [Anderseniella sp.]
MTNPATYDVIITGAGLAGLTCALALSGPHLSIPLRTLVVDAGPSLDRRDHSSDTRGSAITFGSRNLLQALGVWQSVAGEAQPFRRIIVTDAGASADAAPVLLNFMPDTASDAPSAWMLENGTLLRALTGAVLDCSNIDVVTGALVTSFEFGNKLARVETADGRSYEAKLAIAADGRNSAARRHAGIEVASWAYNQSAITLTINHAEPHHGCAEEHFRKNGPLAILPLTGNRSSLVWVEATAETDRIMALDDGRFLDELKQRIGNHLGEITLASERTSWPLGLQIAKSFTSTRLALIGDAAHVIHPIAGLGFNLGLKDIAAIAECILLQARRGQDIGGPATLQEYESWRRADTLIVAGMCDALARVFSNDITPLALARQAGLRLVNNLPPVKRFFLDRAAGTAGRQPALMTGGRL